MKKKRIAILLLLAIMALTMTACNNPLLAAATAEGASDFEAEIEAQVQAALAEAEASGELSFIADEEAAPEVIVEEIETTPEPEAVVTAEPTAVIPEIEVCTDRAEFITDVTVSDGSDFTPGQAFTKTWRLRNAGTCTWTSSYDLVFDHGDAMGGPASQQLAGLVHPGGTVDLSIELTAPSSEGGYKGYWLLRSGDGVLFGIGADASVAFWVEIEVLEEEDDAPLILELVPIPMFPIFVSSGSGQSLPTGGCFDLDAGNLIGCGSAAADFRYNAELKMEGFPPTMKMVYELDPRNGASFDYFGNTTPTGSDCQAAGLSAATFNVQSKVYCYQTEAGKYGYLKITSADLMHISFDWTTYTFP